MVLKNEILVYNLNKEKIPPPKFFQELVNKVLVVLAEKNKVNLSLIFINPQVSRRLNKSWRHKDEIASVLSFPLLENLSLKFGKEEKILGDVFLCPKLIKSQAQKLNISVDLLYLKLIIHSLLHLYGYNHSKAKDRCKMERLEDKILKLVNK
ncbi:MAG: rRNA maturation RNase YbeY [Candidatus Paceibacterota bacterium]|jgi:probable rRNA maturation factor